MSGRRRVSFPGIRIRRLVRIRRALIGIQGHIVVRLSPVDRSRRNVCRRCGAGHAPCALRGRGGGQRAASRSGCIGAIGRGLPIAALPLITLRAAGGCLLLFLHIPKDARRHVAHHVHIDTEPVCDLHEIRVDHVTRPQGIDEPARVLQCPGASARGGCVAALL